MRLVPEHACLCALASGPGRPTPRRVSPLVEKCRFSLFSEGGGVDGADVKMLSQRPERRSESDVLGVWNACGEDSSVADLAKARVFGAKRGVRDDAGAEESDPCRSDLRAHAVEWV